MADRTSAELFGMFFGLLAENPTKKNKELARRVFEMTSSYDFDIYQMECYDALEVLGLQESEEEDAD